MAHILTSSVIVSTFIMWWGGLQLQSAYGSRQAKHSRFIYFAQAGSRTKNVRYNNCLPHHHVIIIHHKRPLTLKSMPPAGNLVIYLHLLQTSHFAPLCPYGPGLGLTRCLNPGPFSFSVGWRHAHRSEWATVFITSSVMGPHVGTTGDHPHCLPEADVGPGGGRLLSFCLLLVGGNCCTVRF